MTTPDFLRLYRELDVEPGCSLDEFRLAYRRRVAGLHPDRVGEVGEGRLTALIQGYEAALDFHREYGRLPGAPPPPLRGAPDAEGDRRGTRRRIEAAPPPDAWAADDVMEDEPPRRKRWRIASGMLLLAGLLGWWWSRPGPAPLDSHGPDLPREQRGTVPASDSVLRMGMAPEEVLSLLGHPISRELDGTHWSYGPSWVRFRCARVADWYSSPLKPIKTGGGRPTAADLERFNAAGERRCPPMPQIPSTEWPRS